MCKEKGRKRVSGGRRGGLYTVILQASRGEGPDSLANGGRSVGVCWRGAGDIGGGDDVHYHAQHATPQQRSRRTRYDGTRQSIVSHRHRKVYTTYNAQIGTHTEKGGLIPISMLRCTVLNQMMPCHTVHARTIPNPQTASSPPSDQQAPAIYFLFLASFFTLPLAFAAGTASFSFSCPGAFSFAPSFSGTTGFFSSSSSSPPCPNSFTLE